MLDFNPRRLTSRSDSQDSFACDLDQKPEDQYAARSDKFALPLSALGKHSSPIRVSCNATASSSYHKDHSPPSGKILVEATPSHSGSSQPDEPLNLSQQLEATQLVDDHGEVFRLKNDPVTVDKDGNASGYESSEPSSSYHRFLDGERTSEPQNQATQPSTQVEDSTVEPFPDDAIPWSNLRSAPHPSVSSAPHSLLSMVAPENRWRYRQYLGTGSGGANGMILPSTFGQTSGSRNRRTPSSFPASPVGLSIPSGPSTTRHTHLGIRPPSPVLPDAMDIVPDSEPIAHEEDLQTSANSVHLSKRPMSRDGDMDMDMDFPEPTRRLVHRREEEEEEEEEIPLASLAAKQAKNLIAMKGNGLTDMPPPGKMPAQVRPILVYCHFVIHVMLGEWSRSLGHRQRNEASFESTARCYKVLGIQCGPFIGARTRPLF